MYEYIFNKLNYFISKCFYTKDIQKEARQLKQDKFIIIFTIKMIHAHLLYF